MIAERVTVRLDRRLRQRLLQLARRSGKSESELVREALEAYSAAHGLTESRYDVARRAGVIGIVRDAPADLSTNPKYFEGFGAS